MSDLEVAYRKRFEAVLTPLSSALSGQIESYLDGESRIDRIVVRPKSIIRFMKKAAATENGKPKYSEPLQQIQDQIGARVITFYKSDVHLLSQVLLKYFRPIESKDHLPESEWQFGYFGRHHVLLIPTDLQSPSMPRELLPICFELQIKTLFQHAWSEANHDLGYKPDLLPLGADENRQLAFTSAQAWGADMIFDDMFKRRAK